jgi:hypothetical protein
MHPLKKSIKYIFTCYYKTFFILHSSFFIFFSVFSQEANDWYPIDSRMARNHNVSKKLKGDVLVYAIWVDTKSSRGWTNYDINTASDSINKAVNWLKEQAVKNNISLNISFDYLTTDTNRCVEQNLPGPVSKVLAGEDGIEVLEKWGNRVVNKVYPDFKDKERLVAKLRDQYNVESVVLLYMLNNYYKDDCSISLNTMSNDYVEFAVTSFKEPALLAHEILHIFGAADLFYHRYSTTKKAKTELKEMFPDDIMASYHEPLYKLEIGPMTKYLIGWTDIIDPKFIPYFREQKSEVRKGRDVVY